jgi:hypothetical protein
MSAVVVGGLVTLDVDARGRATWVQPGGTTYRTAHGVEAGWLVRGAHSTVSRQDAVQTARAREAAERKRLMAERAAEQMRKRFDVERQRLARAWPALADAPLSVLAAAHLQVTPDAVRSAGACATGVDAFLRRYGADGTEPVALGAVWLAAPDARPWLERAAGLVLAA